MCSLHISLLSSDHRQLEALGLSARLWSCLSPSSANSAASELVTESSPYPLRAFILQPTSWPFSPYGRLVSVISRTPLATPQCLLHPRCVGCCCRRRHLCVARRLATLPRLSQFTSIVCSDLRQISLGHRMDTPVQVGRSASRMGERTDERAGGWTGEQACSA